MGIFFLVFNEWTEHKHSDDCACEGISGFRVCEFMFFWDEEKRGISCAFLGLGFQFGITYNED